MVAQLLLHCCCCFPCCCCCWCCPWLEKARNRVVEHSQEICFQRNFAVGVVAAVVAVGGGAVVGFVVDDGAFCSTDRALLATHWC